MAAGRRRSVDHDAGEYSAVSLELLYRRHHAWLISKVRARFGTEQAEDLVQEAYIRAAAYQGLAVRSPKALLMQIATRVAIDGLRRRRAATSRDRFLVAEPRCLSSQSEALTLRQVIMSLPPKVQEVFLLSRFTGLTYEEIAVHLGISVKAVEWRMAKALRLCASMLRR
jgi:RNA polymerase sigma factor (sigma-70 family)